MKYFPEFIAPSGRKCRKPLSTGLRSDSVRSVPVRKDDQVKVVRGTYKGREGKVLKVYRRKWVIHVERISRKNYNAFWI